MPEARKKNVFKVLAGAVLAAALVVAPLVTAGASAKDPELKGEVGQLVPWHKDMNDVSYWQDLYEEFDAKCYKSSGNTDHGTISKDKKTVTLKPFQDSWPGDRWQLLVIKGGSEKVNVVELPKAGVAYASPRNKGGNQADVSHWIVCKGTTPEQPPAPKDPTQDVDCVSITVDYGRALVNGDHINLEYAPGRQVNAYVDLNVAGGWNGLGLRFSDGTTKPLTKSEVASGVIVWKYSSLIADPTFTVSFVQTNQTDTWPNLKCGVEKPADKVTYEETKRYSCFDSTVIVTTVKTTIGTEWNGQAWIELAPEKTSDVVTRPMTDDEKADAEGKDCRLPIEKVERDAWKDGVWDCGDTTVEQTRTVTTTVYSFGPGDEVVEESDTETEEQTRDLTQDEIAECPLLPGEIRSVCQGDVPYLGYEVTLPEGYDGGEDPLVTITFVNPDGDDHVVGGQPLSGSLLWPGASADEPMMWPGWELVGGEYVPTDGNFAWTRGTAEDPLVVRFDVNPSYTTEIVYPEATALCANPPVGGPGEEEVPGEGIPGTEEPEPSPGTEEPQPAPGTEEPTPGEETPGESEEESTETPTTGTPAGTDSEALAVTGGGVSPLVAVGGAAVLVAGIAVVLIVAYRRRTGVQ